MAFKQVDPPEGVVEVNAHEVARGKAGAMEFIRRLVTAAQAGRDVEMGFGTTQDPPGFVISTLDDFVAAHSPDEARHLARVCELSLARFPQTSEALGLSTVASGLRSCADDAEREMAGVEKITKMCSIRETRHRECYTGPNVEEVVVRKLAEADAALHFDVKLGVSSPPRAGMIIFTINEWDAALTPEQGENLKRVFSQTIRERPNSRPAKILPDIVSGLEIVIEMARSGGPGGIH